MAINDSGLKFPCSLIYEKMYRLGVIILIIAILLRLLWEFYYILWAIDWSLLLVLLSGALLSIATLIEYAYVVMKIYSSVLFRFVLAGLALFAYKLSEIFANDFVNEFVGVDPSYFPFATSVISFLFVPASWFLIVFFVIFILISIYWIIIFFEKRRDGETLKFINVLARFLGLFSLLMLISFSFEYVEEAENFYDQISGEILLETEYFSKTHCKNVNSGELSATLDRGYVSVYNKKEKTFITKECQI
ncbi:hypothetical protein [Marinobacterium rhizophilum]|uniref:hypothetical protein n=1 Tax=Marinobacterium rhizophilum TaxID=420402 RepID=UPI0003672B05|nr:hypothetical protein [Marinobacterium rhizophilum]